MAAKKNKEKVEETPKVEYLESHIFLNEEQICEAVKEAMIAKGYIVSALELEFDCSRQLVARLYAQLPKDVVKKPETQLQD